jgi:hypothetical protein
MLHYPGPGPINVQLPPGSISIPLEKAPSGHLVMVVDEYERVAARSGGTPETSLQLTTMQVTQLQPEIPEDDDAPAAMLNPVIATPSQSQHHFDM